MHTFFINTSGNEFENYAEIFEIQYETRRLIPLACPLADWEDKDKGFKACASQMGEMIDNYKDINNDFNLIVYVDLLAFEAYTSIPRDTKRAPERRACLNVLQLLLKNYIEDTLLTKLEEDGRKPKQVLLILEQNQPPQEQDAPDEEIAKYCKLFLALPTEQEINEIVRMGSDGESSSVLTSERFIEEAGRKAKSPIGGGVLRHYRTEIDTFLKDLNDCKLATKPLEQPLKTLWASIARDENGHNRNHVQTVSFITNRRAGVTNKQEQARRDLRLSFYIMSCVRDKSIYQKLDRETLHGEPQVKEVPEINDWDKVGDALREKSLTFSRQYHRVSKRNGEVAAGKLAPVMYMPDYAGCGLYRNGEQSEDVISSNVKANQSDARMTSGKVSQVQQTQLEERLSMTLLPKQEDSETENAKKGASTPRKASGAKMGAAYYEKKALNLRLSHLKFFGDLKTNITEELSHYAGRGLDDKPATLAKREVIPTDADILLDEERTDRRSDADFREKDNRSTDSMQAAAREAYAAVLLNYTEFCASRSVAVTDIEQQCNRFITTVHQIEASLRYLSAMALGLLMAVVVLYIPYLVLQWSAITANVLSLIIAGISLGIPLVVLSTVFGVVAAGQRRKYEQAWDAYKAQSDAVMQDNKDAANKFQQLLTAYIPALRYIYQYKLDVDFYVECWELAQAKIHHHENKLRTRAETVVNIIEDLELDESEWERDEHNGRDGKDAINYHLPFCVGKENRDFYEILDEKVMEAVFGKK